MGLGSRQVLKHLRGYWCSVQGYCQTARPPWPSVACNPRTRVQSGVHSLLQGGPPGPPSIQILSHPIKKEGRMWLCRPSKCLWSLECDTERVSLSLYSSLMWTHSIPQATKREGKVHVRSPLLSNPQRTRETVMLRWLHRKFPANHLPNMPDN